MSTNEPRPSEGRPNLPSESSTTQTEGSESGVFEQVESEIKPYKVGLSAIWRNEDGDAPVTLLGHAGERGGKHYFLINSRGGSIPEDEIIGPTSEQLANLLEGLDEWLEAEYLQTADELIDLIAETMNNDSLVNTKDQRQHLIRKIHLLVAKVTSGDELPKRVKLIDRRFMDIARQRALARTAPAIPEAAKAQVPEPESPGLSPEDELVQKLDQQIGAVKAELKALEGQRKQAVAAAQEKEIARRFDQSLRNDFADDASERILAALPRYHSPRLAEQGLPKDIDKINKLFATVFAEYLDISGLEDAASQSAIARLRQQLHGQVMKKVSEGVNEQYGVPQDVLSRPQTNGSTPPSHRRNETLGPNISQLENRKRRKRRDQR